MVKSVSPTLKTQDSFDSDVMEHLQIEDCLWEGLNNSNILMLDEFVNNKPTGALLHFRNREFVLDSFYK